MRQLVSSLLVTLIVAFPAVGPAQEDSFSESLDVQAVNVEVVVTNESGERVPGLTAQDFRLYMDGQPVPLEFFLEVRQGRAVAPPAQSAAALPPGFDKAVSGNKIGNSYLIFIDTVLLPFELRKEALHKLAAEVRSLDPEDRVALVAFDGEELRVLSDWTAPGEHIAQKLEAAIREGTAESVMSEYAFVKSFGSFNGTMNDVMPGSRPFGADTFLDNYVSQMLPEVPSSVERFLRKIARESVDAAAASQRAFALSATGRKVMVIVSRGWFYDDYSLALALRKARGKGAEDDTYEILRPLTDSSNQLGFTVYPIHLQNVARTNLLKSEETPAAWQQKTLSIKGGVARGFNYEMWSKTLSSLDFSASETGGKVMLAEAPQHFAQIEEDIGSYYWIGFTHAGSDDKRRDLRVEVVRPGLSARSRTSFLPLSRQAKTSLEAESALLTGRLSEAKPLQARIVGSKRPRKGIMEASLVIELPVDEITFVPEQGGNYRARLELRVAALDQNGGRLDEIPVIPLDFALDGPPAKSTFLTYETTIRMRALDQELRLSLYDALSGQTLTTQLRVKRDEIFSSEPAARRARR